MIFTKVFKATGTKNGRTWTRWDYKTAEGERYVHFADTAEIPLDTAVNAETNGDGLIQVWSRAEGNTQSVEPQATPNGSRATSSQDDARGKTRAIIAAQLAPALFNSLSPNEQSFDAALKIAEGLVEYAFNGIRDSVPF